MAPVIKADVVISYDMADADFVKRFTAKLKEHKVNFWFPPPGKMTSELSLKKGQALLNCKVFIMVMSSSSLNNNSLCDELSLAYISNKAILPIGLQYFRALAANMNGGLKLMLAKIQYTFFVKEDDWNKNFSGYLAAIGREITAFDERLGEVHTEPEENTETDRIPINIRYRRLASKTTEEENNARKISNNGDTEEAEINGEEMKETETQQTVDFWERHFAARREVTWIDFRSKFLEDYQLRISDDLGLDNQKLMINIMYRDLFQLMKSIKLSVYNLFTYGSVTQPNDDGSNIADSFYDRLREYAIGSFAMHEVFNMESSVRLTAVQNLGSFQTPGVIAALFDLVNDSDPNIRAVAALALAKTGKRNKKIEGCLIKLLNDEDRLVRESTCLSLAHMRCHNAVPFIIETWRNDPIKHVREAAEVALSRVGGSDADQAIKVTQVLTEEMNNLKTLKH